MAQEYTEVLNAEAQSINSLFLSICMIITTGDVCFN